jgi:predicted phage terminase large subunit-like protein
MAGLSPDPWQTRTLLDCSTDRLLFLCSRQSGKSTVAAALALREALLSPPALVLLLSPTLRQSGELFRDKVLRLYDALGRPVLPARLTATELVLTNGSRIVSLPENEETVRGFSAVSLLIIDEAARVQPDLYRTVRPMLATSAGKLVCLSTPFGRQGWFYEAWQKEQGWRRVKITAAECPRISKEFLAEERAALGGLWYRQEYECEFTAIEGAEWPPEYFPDSLWFDDWPSGLLARAIALDPSKGRDSKSGDYAAFALAAVDTEGTIWVEADLFRGKPAEFLAEQAVEHQRSFQADVFGVETIQFQQLFAVIINLISRRRQVFLPIVEMQDNTRKEVRIRRLGPYLAQERFRFRNTPGTRLLVDQLREFPEGAHDDAPDALEMSLRLLSDLLAGRQDEEQEGTVLRT